MDANQTWTIDNYIDAAKARHTIDTDRALGRFMGFQGTPVSMWRCGRAWPAEETIVKLAILADRDPKLALLDLKRWSAGPAARKVWDDIGKLLGQVAAPVLVAAFFGLSPGLASAGQSANMVTSPAPTLYIMENRRRRKYSKVLGILARLFNYLDRRRASADPITAAHQSAAAMLPHPA